MGRLFSLRHGWCFACSRPGTVPDGRFSIGGIRHENTEYSVSVIASILLSASIRGGQTPFLSIYNRRKKPCHTGNGGSLRSGAPSQNGVIPHRRPWWPGSPVGNRPGNEHRLTWWSGAPIRLLPERAETWRVSAYRLAMRLTRRDYRLWSASPTGGGGHVNIYQSTVNFMSGKNRSSAGRVLPVAGNTIVLIGLMVFNRTKQRLRRAQR
jgi:hypothetical protein